MLSAVAAVTLGIGLVTFMFCGVSAFLFQTLPFAEPKNLVYTAISAAALREINGQQTSFEGLSAFALSATKESRLLFLRRVPSNRFASRGGAR